MFVLCGTAGCRLKKMQPTLRLRKLQRSLTGCERTRYNFKAVSDLEPALRSEYTVRTSGGDSSAGPPLCILNWDSIRIDENGANPLSKIIRDESGTAIGRELHRLGHRFVPYTA